MTSAATSAQPLTFAYDALGRNLSQTGASGSYSSQYDLAGRRTRLTHPDGFYVDQDYLVTGEMTAIRENGATSGIGVLATYGYDQLGRRSSRTYGNGESTSYGYDAVGRLNQLALDLGGSATTNDLTLTFLYNPASQISSTTRSNDLYSWTGHGSGSASSSVDGLNRTTAQGGTTFAFDAKGNMTSDGIKSYAYDSENKSLGVASSPFHYDPLNRLDGVGSPLAIHYENYVDGLVAERSAGSSAVGRRHVFGPGTDEPIVWYEGSGTSDRRFYHSDERGSTIALTDGSANLLATYRYDEYGKVQTSGAYVARFLYTGQRYFGSFGIYYYKARMYDPRIGKFMQTDPIGFKGGMNLYAYVKGDPINYQDPSGLLGEACAGTLIKSACANDSQTDGGGSGQPKSKSGAAAGFGRSAAELGREAAQEAAKAASDTYAAVVDAVEKAEVTIVVTGRFGSNTLMWGGDLAQWAGLTPMNSLANLLTGRTMPKPPPPPPYFTEDVSDKLRREHELIKDVNRQMLRADLLSALADLFQWSGENTERNMKGR